MTAELSTPPDARAAGALEAASLTAAAYPRIRYMGSKYRLLPHLAEVFAEVGGSTALDAFSGSGVVSYLLKRQGFAVTANDMLEFPGTLAAATVVNQSTLLTADDVARITGPAVDDRDFIRRTFDGVFFSAEDRAFLDSAWSHIATMDGDERALAISALVLSAARKQPRGVFTISGDLSHYDDGRRDLRLSMREHFVEHVADYNAAVFAGAPATVTRQEASVLRPAPYDVVYLDPPYAPPTDDNCYVKRFHFLEGLSRYWEGDALMLHTNTKKLPKPHTGYSHRRTIVDAFRDTFARFHDAGAIVLSYGSNALPDKETLLALLREVKDDVEVRAIPHTYHYGTHRAAARRVVDEYIFIAR
ncbi:DNA adenine methylase [Nocardioides sambongensis]|uniref:DNA adenine methylase n=1 Tax=Nocardioides sambongensis TaxID=2589074 RepID=UPI0018C87894|nr:DNA adenine methylase [Nocardioides sambongensis]